MSAILSPTLNSNTNSSTKQLPLAGTGPGFFNAVGSSISKAVGGGQNSIGGGSVFSSTNAPVLQQKTVNLPSALVTPTSSGGVTFPAASASNYSKAPIAPTLTKTSNPTESLSSFINNPPLQSPNGGTFSTDGTGNVTAYSPSSGYSINTSGPIDSNSLGNTKGMSDLLSQHNKYSDYVNALSQAQGYSPDYINALQGQYGAQTQGAQLNLNSAALNSNLFTGNNLPGDTMAYAQGATAKAQAQNTLQQAQNSIQQLGANQALNTAQLQRTGNISAAQTQLQYSPQGMAGSNAIEQYNSLQQSYPGAQIPEYNQALTPEQNQQVASYIVANSPAYKSQFQSQYQTPGGGTGIYNKLDTGGLQQNQDGTISLVSDAAASLGGAQKASLTKNIDTYNTLAPAYKAANDDFSYITNFMQQAGINKADVPIANQLQNAINTKLVNPGAAAAFTSAIQSLRSNYANLLSARTGSVVGVNEQAEALIPNNLTVKQLQQVQEALNANGKNILDATQQQIQQSLGSIQGGSTGFTGNAQNGSTGGFAETW